MPTALLSAAGVEGCPHGPKAGGRSLPASRMLGLGGKSLLFL